MAYPYPPASGFGARPMFGQNRSSMDYWQRLMNRMLAEQILAEQDQAVQAPQAQFSPAAYQTDPEMPYLSGLSPMARYNDMGLRQRGRQAQFAQTPAQAAAAQQLREEVTTGITRQPSGAALTNAGGFISAPQMGIRTLSSPYGKGVSSMGAAPGRGTFSFTTADGTVVRAPMTAIQDPRFRKFMREEELGRTKQEGSGKSLSFEDVMSQIDTART